MEIQFGNSGGISEYWLGQKSGLHWGKDPFEAKNLSEYSKSKNTPGRKKKGAYVLSQSLMDQMQMATPTSGSSDTPEINTPVPVPRLSDPNAVEWHKSRPKWQERQV